MVRLAEAAQEASRTSKLKGGVLRGEQEIRSRHRTARALPEGRASRSIPNGGWLLKDAVA